MVPQPAHAAAATEPHVHKGTASLQPRSRLPPAKRANSYSTQKQLAWSQAGARSSRSAASSACIASLACQSSCNQHERQWYGSSRDTPLLPHASTVVCRVAAAAAAAAGAAAAPAAAVAATLAPHFCAHTSEKKRWNWRLLSSASPPSSRYLQAGGCTGGQDS